MVNLLVIMITIPSTAIKDDGNDAMNINHHYKDDSGDVITFNILKMIWIISNSTYIETERIIYN